MRKRSSYRPRQVLRDPVGWVVTGNRRAAEAAEPMTVLRARNHWAMQRLSRGEADDDDINVLTSASNQAIAMMRLGHGTDWKVEIEAAADALLEVTRRGAATGRYVCRAAELKALNLQAELHELQLAKVTVREFERARSMERNALTTGRGRYVVIGNQQTQT